MTSTKDHSKRLETTATSITEHVQKGTTTGISTSITSWIKTLGAHKELEGIAADLEELKTAISEKDGKQIVSIMTKLGAETTKAAENAEEGDAKKIKMLGKSLTAGAKAIGKLVK